METSVRARKRIEISEVCAVAARKCLVQSTGLPARFFGYEAAAFAIKGFHLNPCNSDCCDILMELFEMELIDAVEKKERYLNSDEGTVLRELTEKDIIALPFIQDML